jgi:hypothetical protein
VVLALGLLSQQYVTGNGISNINCLQFRDKRDHAGEVNIDPYVFQFAVVVANINKLGFRDPVLGVCFEFITALYQFPFHFRMLQSSLHCSVSDSNITIVGSLP